MRNLFQFILKNISWLVAIILITISLYLVFSQNSYQRSVYLSSANLITGKIYETSDKAASFFYLRKENYTLLERLAELEHELELTKEQLQLNELDTIHIGADLNEVRFDFIPAEVINISLSGINNFITINKGTLDGIQPDMGVVSHKGVVGVVHKVSRHYATVIPIINPQFRLSARLKNSDSSGSLMWDGKNISIAQLGELPKHERYNRGDTVVTSFSRIFPKDIILGYITEEVRSKDDNFILLDMKIATDFHALMNVLVIDDKQKEEIFELENTRK